MWENITNVVDFQPKECTNAVLMETFSNVFHMYIYGFMQETICISRTATHKYEFEQQGTAGYLRKELVMSQPELVCSI